MNYRSGHLSSMNSKERFQAAMLGDVPDRIPVFYQHFSAGRHVLNATGLTIREGFHDPETFARLCLKGQELFGFDNIMLGWGDLLTEARAMGSTWRFPEKDFYPRIDSYAVKDLADVDRLAVVDPMEDEFWSVPLKAGRIVRDKIGTEIAIVGSTLSPFFVATELRGYENIMMDALSTPDVVEKMVSVALESLKLYGERLSALGIEEVFIDDSGASGALVSEDMCGAFDTKFVKAQVQRYRALGLRSIIHNDAQMPYLDLQAGTGAACLHFNNDLVDLPEVFARYRGKVTLMSGINHQELLFKHTPAEVEDAVRKVIDLYGKEPGLVIAPGCEVPFKSPLENMVMLRQACETYGRL
ncbi:MAG: uroporphyrinogen decarboxylase family protein [Methanomassiliicoccus sp.]|nr:uroporphyrinogen decarboxylase family protein [Methanomassiliicoccus sp.]